MIHRRLPWAELTRAGIPALVVSRSVLDLRAGESYPIPDLSDKVQIRRARQLYEQRKVDPIQVDAEILPSVQPAKKGVKHGSR